MSPGRSVNPGLVGAPRGGGCVRPCEPLQASLEETSPPLECCTPTKRQSSTAPTSLTPPLEAESPAPTCEADDAEGCSDDDVGRIATLGLPMANPRRRLATIGRMGRKENHKVATIKEGMEYGTDNEDTTCSDRSGDELARRNKKVLSVTAQFRDQNVGVRENARFHRRVSTHGAHQRTVSPTMLVEGLHQRGRHTTVSIPATKLCPYNCGPDCCDLKVPQPWELAA